MRIPRLSTAVSLIATSVILSGMITSHIAGAISDVYFDPKDTNRSGQSYGLSVGETQYVRKSAANLKVYFPGKNGKVTFHGHNYCPGGPDSGITTSGNVTVYDLQSLNATIDGKKTVNTFYGAYRTAGSSGCNSSKTISVTNADYEDKLKLYYVTIAVTHIQKKSGYDNIQNYFTVSTPTTGGTISHEGGKGKGYEVTMEHAGSSGHTDYNIKFGTDCKVKKNPVRIALYDLDNNGGSGAQLGGKVTVSLKANNSTRKIKVTTESQTNKVKMTGLVNSAKPSGDNKTVYLYFNADFKTGERYILSMDNVYYNNTIQFQTPFDGKYYDSPCGDPPTTKSKVWNATPRTAMTLQVNGTGSSVAKSGTSANPTWVKPKDIVRWEHTVTNNVTSDRKTNKKIKVMIKRNNSEGNLADRSWGSGKSPGASMINKSGDGRTGSGKMKREITQDDMGKKICQRVVIDPSGIKTNGSVIGEKTSSWRCVLVTATGGDIEASVTASPSTYSYYPSLSAKAEVSSTGFPVTDRFKKKNYTRTGYDWKIFEAKFKSQPSGSIVESEAADCKSVTDKAPYKNIMIAGTCKEAGSGTNLFANGGSPTVTAPSKQQGPDPIGTWTCYTLQYRINPKPLATLRDTDTGDIRKFVDDWNDGNKTSKEPTRWTDGRWKNSNDVWKGGAAKNRANEYKKYKEAVPLDPVRYLFTPFDEDSCSVSGIDPKVQIRGNDLKADGNINTSVRRNSQGAFGSSAEYGVISSGPNSGMASGSGLLAGALQASPQANWSPLTFTNNVPNTFGNFDSVPVDSDEPEPTDIIEGDATFNGLPSDATAQGARKIYKVNGTLVISGNLQYSNAYTKISKIPRIIIVANNIQIQPGVTRIDPWLIAENISTCGAPRGAAWGDSAGEALSGANLIIGECNNPLTFNGAVSVANLYLYRTGGSRVLRSDLPGAKWSPDTVDPDAYCEGTCSRKYALSAPAEVFNLRPDVYLSSLSGMSTSNPVATTDKITELPPRF